MQAEQAQAPTTGSASKTEPGSTSTSGGQIQLKSGLRGLDYDAQVQRLAAPGGGPRTPLAGPQAGPAVQREATANKPGTTTEPTGQVTTAPDPKHAALLAYLAVPAQRAALVAGLAANTPAVVADFTKRTEAIRPLPKEANDVLAEAWAIVDQASPPDMRAMAMIIGLRFGLEVEVPDADPAKHKPTDPTPVHYREIWKSLGRLPDHHLESKESRKNTPSFTEDAPEAAGNGDPVDRLYVRQPKEGEQNMATSSRDYIKLTQSEASSQRNRFPVETTATGKSGTTRSNPCTLPQQLGPVPEGELPAAKKAREEKEAKVRKDFKDANITNLSHSVLHEWGHLLDRTRGIMDSGAYNRASWVVHDKNAAKAIVPQLGLDTDPKLGASGEKRAELEQKLADGGPAALAKGDPATVGDLWEGNAAGLATAKASKAGKWLMDQHVISGPDAYTLPPVDIGGRVYVHHSSKEITDWSSYDYAYRVNHSVSDYQWKTHREWFAECYAVYYDTTPPGTLLEARDPGMKAQLDVLHVTSKKPGKK